MDKCNLRCNGFGSTQCIDGKGFFKVCVTVGRIVKTCNGFVEGRSRIIGQLVLEFAQCFCHSAEVCLTTDLLQTDGILYKIIGSPGIAFRVDIVGCTGQSGNDVQAFSARVAALCLNLCP